MAGDTIKFLIEMRDGASKPLKKVGKAAEDAAEDAKGATIKYTELASKLTLLGMAAKAATKIVGALTKPINDIAKGGIAAGAQMEGFETRLNVLMGSSAAAKERLDELFQIGSTTPFELPGLIEAEVNLRALGVNAEKTLPMVMDFAGAMGTDLASAAVEVGRAMQFGAGAVETISGRALRAQVELRTGADALKMSTEEFREAMIETLTDPDGIFKGGTEKLAATFDGMLSNLQDSFFKFKKDVGDAGLFNTAKETLRVMLELIDQNADGLRVMARVISDGVVQALFGSLKLAGLLLDSFLAVGAALMDIAQKYTEVVLFVSDALAGTFLGNTKEQQKALEDRLATIKDTKDELISMGGFATMAADAVDLVQTRVSKLDRRRSGGATVTKPSTAMVPPTEPKAGKDKEAPPTAEELEAIFLGIEDSLKELQKVIRDNLSTAALADAFTKGISSPFNALTSMMGPAGGLINSLSALGQMGTDQVVDTFRKSIKGVVKAIFEVVPELITQLPEVLITSLVEALFHAFKRLLDQIVAIFQPRKQERNRKQQERLEKAERLGLKGPQSMQDLQVQLLELFMPKRMGKVHSGTAHIDRTGAFLLQAGEAVIPNSGTTTQGMARRMGGGGGMNVTINTNVVDKNAIRGLGKLLEKEFGSMGRSTSPVFNSPTGARG